MNLRSWVLLALTAALAAVGAIPSPALADRGALSVEGGAMLSAARLAPPLGTGESVVGSLGGAVLGLRYGVRNSIELTASGTYLEPAQFYHQNVAVPCSGSVCTGQLASRYGRWTAGVGADYVAGLTFRFHLGAEVGWAEAAFDRLDHSTGSAVRRARTVDGLLVAPRVGVEWAVTDHLSFALTPRLEFLIGEPQMAVSLPLTVAYSWYL